MASLYVCYQSLLEPLTQTQVVAYLEGLTRTGYSVVLLTFEPRAPTESEITFWTERLAGKGIAWHWVRYHKRPTVPVTLWDICAGLVASLRLMRKYPIRLIHARSHVPGVMALVLKWLTHTKFLFDLRGFMAEEYVDAGLWREGGVLFRATKHVERVLIHSADGIVVLTHAAARALDEWDPKALAHKPLMVIPCCVDTRRFTLTQGDPQRQTMRTITYAGKLGGWYATREMLAFFSTARQVIPELKLQVWTQSDPTQMLSLARAQGLEAQVAAAHVTPEAMPEKLAAADAGLSFYKRNLSAIGCSPTKIGEYLAAGLPVISNDGIGDVNELLLGSQDRDAAPVGILLNDLSDARYLEAAHKLKTLWEDCDLRERCRSVACEQLSLEQVGWTRYIQLYRSLLPESDVPH